MLPPLLLPDHRVGASSRAFEERTPLRGGAPERLRIEPVPPGEPRATLRPPGPLREPSPSRRGGWLPRLLLLRRGAAL